MPLNQRVITRPQYRAAIRAKIWGRNIGPQYRAAIWGRNMGPQSGPKYGAAI